MSFNGNAVEENCPLSWRRNNSGKSGFEKREKRRNIRKLQTALRDRDLAAVKEILTFELEVDFQYNGQTCLQLAVCEGWYEACAILINKGADVNHTNVEGNSLVNMACWRQHGEVVRLLVNNRADVDSQNECGNTPLYVSASKGYTDIVDILLASGKCNLNLANKSGQTPLFCSSQTGNAVLVSKLLTAGADPNWCDCLHITPLMAAAQSEHTQVLQELLCYGADVNSQDRQGRSAVFYAAQNGCIESLRLLTKYNADLNKTTIKGVTPLLKSILEHQLGAAMVLMESGCDVNLSDKMQQAPVHAVVQQVTSTFSENGNSEMRDLVTCLVRAGADMNVKDNQGWSPLYQAALSADNDMCDLIMAQGTLLTSLTKNGCSPLHAAVIGGSEKIVRKFLDAGCEVNLRDYQGLHPLLTAVTHSINTSIIEMLLENKSDLSITATASKNTALHEAVCRHQSRTAKLLIDHGSSLVALNSERQSALYLACKCGLTHLVSAILAKGTTVLNGPRCALPIHAAAMQGCGATIELLAQYDCDLNQMNSQGKTPLMTAINEQNLSAVRALLQCGCDLYYTQKVPRPYLCCINNASPHPHYDLEPLFLAVTHQATEMITMLLQCYSMMPRKAIRMVKTLLNSTEINTHFTAQQKTDLFTLFAQYTHRPLALTDLCRRCVRANLRAPAVRNVDKLPVGASVKRFVLMEEEFADWIEMEKQRPGGSNGFHDVFVNTSEWR